MIQKRLPSGTAPGPGGAGTPRRNRSAGARALDFVSSIPFGVTMMVLILLWCWIGSAGTAPFGRWFIRQSFEKTEMEWFSWWPFHVLLASLAVSLILATVRRVRLNLPNAGTWTVHAGIIVLMAGSAVYFGRKLEGDMAVYRRAAVLQADQGAAARLVLQPGATARVPVADGEYVVQVVALTPDYELLTGTDQGKRTFAAQIMVNPPAGRPGARPYIRQLLAGYPQYTEDVLPGEGRAVKAIGRALVDDRLHADLDYASADRLHLNDRPALHVRVAGSEEWTELPLRGLPRYRERLSDPTDAVLGPDTPPPAGSLDLHPRPKRPGGEDAGAAPALPADVSFRVTGFLPAAWLDQTREPGGEELAPILKLTLQAQEQKEQLTLLAHEPGRSAAEGPGGLPAEFAWFDDPADLAEWLRPDPPSLRVRVPSRGVDLRLPVEELEQDYAVPGTAYVLRLQRYVPRWVLASTREVASLALVEVAGGGTEFVRAVLAPQEESTRDFAIDGGLLDTLADPDLVLTLEGAREPGLRIAAGPAGLRALFTAEDGHSSTADLTVGTPVTFAEGAVRATVDLFSERSRAVDVPYVIPPAERDLKAGPVYSLVQVEAACGPEKQEFWLRYTHYTHPNRLGFHPRTVEFAGRPPLEVLFSRETLRLPQAVALEEFRLETFPGGTREREYVSRIRFREGDRWSEPREVETNSPTEQAGWWYFQSTWDPPEPGSGYAGLNYTGLGVGNRHGVGVMLLGGLMTVLGTIWAFYVKPVIKRRRARETESARERARERVAGPVAPAPAAATAAHAGPATTAVHSGPAVTEAQAPTLTTARGPAATAVHSGPAATAAHSGPAVTEAQAPTLTTAQGPAATEASAASTPVPPLPGTARRRTPPGGRAAAAGPLAALLLGTALATANAAPDSPALSVGPAFIESVDLSRIRLAAVQEDGRIKTFDSLAREKLRLVNGKLARSVDPVLWYLDLMLAPEHYAEKSVIRIHRPAFRRQLVQTVRGLVPPEHRTGAIAAAELARIERDGLVSLDFLAHPAVRTALSVHERDLMRAAKEVQKLHNAWALADGSVLASLLRVVPVAGDATQPWLTLPEAAVAGMDQGTSPLMLAAAAPAGMRAGDLHAADPHADERQTADPQTADARADDPHAGHTHASGPHGGDPGDVDAADPHAGHPQAAGLHAQLALAWGRLAHAWQDEDAAAATASLNDLATLLPQFAPEAYPSPARLAWEHWYYKNDKLTRAWLLYFLALPPLLMAVVYGLRWARVAGLSLFGLAFALHTLSIVLRWWLAGRIPNANMFEAITASAWFGGLVALLLELFLRRWPVKNLPALAASTYAMLAMMAGHFVPAFIPSFHNDITTVMPVLDRTVWLYIHTNIVIASYALIFFGSVTAVLYLGLRLALRLAPSTRLAALWGGRDGGTMAASRGGAAAIILRRGMQPGEAAETGLARSLDGATMIFLELAFITLWLGTILGAVWADVSWGRPWGWDPKEVFALNTWLVFLVLLHVRMRTRDKALWTAVLAVAGCAVMLFNWIAVNFVIVGLHSYA